MCVWYANRWRVSRWWEFAWQQYFNSSALHLRDCSLSDKVTSWWSYSCQAAQNNQNLEKLQILKLAFLVQNELWNKGIQGQKNSNSFVAFFLKRSEFYLAANPVRILELVTTCISKMQNTQIQSTQILNTKYTKTKIHKYTGRIHCLRWLRSFTKLSPTEHKMQIHQMKWN